MAAHPLCFLLALAMACSYWLLCVSSQSISPARALDALLQEHAYKAFARPRTGVPYDGVVPSNLTGIKIAAMRLRSGSLKNRGVEKYKEFEIPTGVMEFPSVERLVLVYQNLGNWSLSYYPLSGYTFLAPVLGLLAYSAKNLSATGLPELYIAASGKPISITFQNLQSAPNDSNSTPKCVWFNLSGAPSFSNLLSGNKCATLQQGHFSVVVLAGAATAPSPAPLPLRPPPPSNGPAGEENSARKWIIVGSVLGALVAVALLSVAVVWAHALKERTKMQQMQRAADVGEALRITSVGYTKVPAAAITRTQPALENEYVP